jgi:tetratricopeptide (TPR) repeat protein
MGIAALGARSMLDEETLATAVLGLRVAGAAYFLILAMIGVRAVTGTNLTHALGTVVAGLAAVALGSVVYGAVGGFLASPFVLFWLYILFRPNVDFLSGGLRSRQNFRRHLEASTLNPRDADAHYQLGLIYLQRRNYAEAISRFEKAVEIDASDPDPHFQLGKIAREQGRHEDALRHFQACAAQDPKHSSSEVVRELGAANFQLGHTELALSQLQDYVDRREYDAEGQYWLGMVLKRVERREEARAAFQKSVEAASTAPPHLRRQTSRWLKLSRAELK